MPEVSCTVRVAAPLERVYLAAQDIEGLAGYIADVESIKVKERTEVPGGLETISSWVGLLPEFGRKVRWDERDIWNDALHRCDFHMTSGDFDGYEGEWLFLALGEQETEVVLLVRYEYNIPMIGALIQSLIQKKVQESVDRIQAGLKNRAETERD